MFSYAAIYPIVFVYSMDVASHAYSVSYCHELMKMPIVGSVIFEISGRPQQLTEHPIS